MTTTTPKSDYIFDVSTCFFDDLAQRFLVLLDLFRTFQSNVSALALKDYIRYSVYLVAGLFSDSRLGVKLVLVFVFDECLCFSLRYAGIGDGFDEC